jgi:adenylate cyclase
MLAASQRLRRLGAWPAIARIRHGAQGRSRRDVAESAHGRDPRSSPLRSVMKRIPSAPRCKLCAAPFGQPGGAIVRLAGFGASRLNRRLCRALDRARRADPGPGVLRADGLFYGTAARVVDRWEGILHEFVGDEVVALFIPGFPEHAAQPARAARNLVGETGGSGGSPRLPIDVGVHTGVAFVGTVGEGDARDFTALGDAAHTAARLASAAGPGEILVSLAAAAASGRPAARGWQTWCGSTSTQPTWTPSSPITPCG